MSGSSPLREHVLKPLAVRGFFICVPLAIACDIEVSWSVRIRHERRLPSALISACNTIPISSGLPLTTG